MMTCLIHGDYGEISIVFGNPNVVWQLDPQQWALKGDMPGENLDKDTTWYGQAAGLERVGT